MEPIHNPYFPIKFSEKVRSYGGAKKEVLEIRIWERILLGVDWLILSCGHLSEGCAANHGWTSRLGPSCYFIGFGGGKNLTTRQGL